MRFLILSLILFSACTNNSNYDYQVRFLDLDYSDIDSSPLIDTIYNFNSQHNLQSIYRTENLIRSSFDKILDQDSIKNDSIIIELRNSGYSIINDELVDLYKFMIYNIPSIVGGLAYIYNPKFGVVFYTHSHTSNRFYFKKIQYIRSNQIVDSLVMKYNKQEIFDFYWSDIDVPELPDNEQGSESEILEDIEIDLNE